MHIQQHVPASSQLRNNDILIQGQYGTNLHKTGIVRRNKRGSGEEKELAR